MWTAICVFHTLITKNLDMYIKTWLIFLPASQKCFSWKLLVGLGPSSSISSCFYQQFLRSWWDDLYCLFIGKCQLVNSKPKIYSLALFSESLLIASIETNFQLPGESTKFFTFVFFHARFSDTVLVHLVIISTPACLESIAVFFGSWFLIFGRLHLLFTIQGSKFWLFR